jgi:serine carboxypeptidase-like clade 2
MHYIGIVLVLIYEFWNNQIAIIAFDIFLARENLVFLLQWFKKFPQYKHKDLFLTGESYAGKCVSVTSFLENINFQKLVNMKNHSFLFSYTLGRYIPQLANLMIGINKKEKIFNLKGIAVSTFIPFIIYQPCFNASFLDNANAKMVLLDI